MTEQSPPSKLTIYLAKKRIKNFIDEAKSNFPFKDISWTENSWDITLFVHEKCKSRGKGKKKVIIHFKSRQTNEQNKKHPPLHNFYIDFAKAVFSETMRKKKLASPYRLLYALQFIELAMLDLKIEPEVYNLNASIVTHACDLTNRAMSKPWDISNSIERIIKTVIEPLRLSTEPIEWSNPFSFGVPSRNDRTSIDGSIRESKLPNLQAIFELGSIHYNSTNTNDHVVTSYCALAIFAPNRSCEILTLPCDCITSGEGTSGSIMGIRWLPAKGGDPLIKYAASETSEIVAREAIEFLVSLGQQARTAARWYAENPNQLYLPPNMENLRGLPITLEEASTIIGRSTIHASAARKFGLTPTGTQCTDPARIHKKGKKPSLYDFSSLENWVLKRLPVTFPILDTLQGLLWHEALFVLPANIFRSYTEPLMNVPDVFSTTNINNQLGGYGTTSVFGRNKKMAADGSQYKITTHQFRHLMDTLAESKYLSQSLISFWSGRKSIKQNEWYNHLPQEAYIEAYVKLGEQGPNLQAYGPLQLKASETAKNNQITYTDALKIELGSIHSHRHGLCRHHYSLSPCTKDGDCGNCGENAFFKGNITHKREAEVQVKILSRAVSECEKAIASGELGAQKWLDMNAHKLERWESMVSIHNDPEIPDMTLVTLPPPQFQQSKVELASIVRSNELDNAHIEITELQESDDKLDDFAAELALLNKMELL